MRNLTPTTVLGLYSGTLYALTAKSELIFVRHEPGLNISECRSFATRATAFPQRFNWELGDEEPEADFIDSVKQFSRDKYGW